MRAAAPDYMPWKKSSYSAANGNCVEVARIDRDYIGVRDSKNAARPALAFRPAVWRTFTTQIKSSPRP
jgi:Domain of unknown function (DUF397)